ncbi:MAG: 16S rRNA (guanine(527)-N(7))-methyltransferase RsmG [Desulfobacula sp.]|jgi:16S rRNA (guanine527-N7)-methyltransferase|uniref:16S rRNA (guanine(527)-N(7))-methyltransferase RsmG n=1 Tax=Desulfobacula sp. TaxID=2593537 RepID=UPI001D36C882|nr:16S rRNA (guanine(527)-N(7))-methyltransferase RsmG [Desulfobacula sp.]MBT3484685.1 16S rRNA (guanine(527)-N(7))-methyltransferase RsmG [Desulfobacula sp.]MBT3806755.1 16S rRNA (guanine(527)-N(7))-methyltransferase RsmG [Desulfobacula sp.]MBT4027264.1 16S rRNA (guanine(527)-N(7))-methyltransferase RsmG [Desulfobacula sp.]MBT4200759.1 16S rRNA (guanine(527)-N(7))-methyltransferase RsmG [Desulfobacula sp.]
MTHILSKQSIKDFKNYIINGSNDLGIKVADHQADLMILHAKELMAWNKKINLTAIKEPLSIAEKHFIDSIAADSFLGDENTLIDMGSGGGFPGIPIKIMRPSLKIVLIDSSRKKINFLKHVIRILHLKNIEAVHSRVEDLQENEIYKNKFDAVISRAFTNLSNFVNLGSPFVSEKGTLYAMKGKHAKKEITSAISDKFALKTDHYLLPFEKSDRYMIKLTANNIKL